MVFRRKARLTHESSEALERPRDAHARVDLDENALCGVNVDLELAGLVEWRVEEGEEALQTGGCCERLTLLV